LTHQSPAQRACLVEDVFELAVGLTSSVCLSSRRTGCSSFGDGEEEGNTTVLERRCAHHFRPACCVCPTDLSVLQQSHAKSATFELRKHILHVNKPFPAANSNGNFGVLPLERMILIVLP